MEDTTMKKTYTTPEIDITAFMTEDIITASGMNTHDKTDIGTGTNIDLSDESKWE